MTMKTLSDAAQAMLQALEEDHPSESGHCAICRARIDLRTILAAQDAQPVAWFRGVTSPGGPWGPAEHDAEMVWGDDKPDGENWAPLYTTPQQAAVAAESSDKHLTLLMARHHLNLAVGNDRQDLLAFGRDVWAAAAAPDVARAALVELVAAQDQENKARLNRSRLGWYEGSDAAALSAAGFRLNAAWAAARRTAWPVLAPTDLL
jgi:hypothetical protein